MGRWQGRLLVHSYRCCTSMILGHLLKTFRHVGRWCQTFLLSLRFQTQFDSASRLNNSFITARARRCSCRGCLSGCRNLCLHVQSYGLREIQWVNFLLNVNVSSSKEFCNPPPPPPHIWQPCSGLCATWTRGHSWKPVWVGGGSWRNWRGECLAQSSHAPQMISRRQLWTLRWWSDNVPPGRMYCAWTWASMRGSRSWGSISDNCQVNAGYGLAA